jgi:hypothetical protein
MPTAKRTSNLTIDADLKAVGQDVKSVHGNVKQIFGNELGQDE